MKPFIISYATDAGLNIYKEWVRCDIILLSLRCGIWYEPHINCCWTEHCVSIQLTVLICLTAIHHSSDPEARTACRPSWVLHPAHGTILRPGCSAWSAGLHVLLHGPLWREWPLRWSWSLQAHYPGCSLEIVSLLAPSSCSLDTVFVHNIAICWNMQVVYTTFCCGKCIQVPYQCFCSKCQTCECWH